MVSESIPSPTIFHSWQNPDPFRLLLGTEDQQLSTNPSSLHYQIRTLRHPASSITEQPLAPWPLGVQMAITELLSPIV